MDSDYSAFALKEVADEILEEDSLPTRRIGHNSGIRPGGVTRVVYEITSTGIQIHDNAKFYLDEDPEEVLSQTESLLEEYGNTSDTLRMLEEN